MDYLSTIRTQQDEFGQIDSTVMSELPEEIQIEVLRDAKRALKRGETTYTSKMITSPTLASFSELQVTKLLKQSQVQQKINELKTTLSPQNVTYGRIASEPNKDYILVQLDAPSSTQGSNTASPASDHRQPLRRFSSSQRQSGSRGGSPGSPFVANRSVALRERTLNESDEEERVPEDKAEDSFQDSIEDSLGGIKKNLFASGAFENDKNDYDGDGDGDDDDDDDDDQAAQDDFMRQFRQTLESLNQDIAEITNTSYDLPPSIKPDPSMGDLDEWEQYQYKVISGWEDEETLDQIQSSESDLEEDQDEDGENWERDLAEMKKEIDPLTGIEKVMGEIQQEEQYLSKLAQSKSRELAASYPRSAGRRGTLHDEIKTDIIGLLRLFGIPYIESPMEAEAQCAYLEEAGLVDGIVTDDSDTFLFGGKTVFKNFFGSAQTKKKQEDVECYLMSDIEEKLGLSRNHLVGMALMLGCDYTHGVAGIGPKLSAKIIDEFPGDLTDFVAWLKADPAMDGRSRKTLRKKLEKIKIGESFPEDQVFSAFMDPVVDHSLEKFSWAEPNVPALTKFAQEKLEWSEEKAERELKMITGVSSVSTSSTSSSQPSLSQLWGSFIHTKKPPADKKSSGPSAPKKTTQPKRKTPETKTTLAKRQKKEE
eukprot:TRINITY_DN624_c0_g1_i1.p1 TRINITY_DN624_c0_g1~~TRINITY_DN624_c0_g1_i1.p1  ORF type:complete len:651 (-),score=171.58 TRINITY_DN624_c0_g1_i1:15-1967(-)